MRTVSTKTLLIALAAGMAATWICVTLLGLAVAGVATPYLQHHSQFFAARGDTATTIALAGFNAIFVALVALLLTVPISRLIGGNWWLMFLAFAVGALIYFVVGALATELPISVIGSLLFDPAAWSFAAASAAGFWWGNRLRRQSVGI
jgi:hypothetical protein